MLETTTEDRVRAHTARDVNEEIDAETKQRVLRAAGQSEAALSRRIEELDAEWDVERWLEANASSLALAGIVFGLAVNRKWFAVSGVVLSFLLLHAVQGWCPPLPVLRRLGVRTQREIDEEKCALKYLRGDFKALKSVIEEAHRAIEASAYNYDFSQHAFFQGLPIIPTLGLKGSF